MTILNEALSPTYIRAVSGPRSFILNIQYVPLFYVHTLKQHFIYISLQQPIGSKKPYLKYFRIWQDDLHLKAEPFGPPTPVPRPYRASTEQSLRVSKAFS